MATQPESVRVFAPAKINLFLHVTGKRSDGFHDLQSLVAFADVGDDLLIAVSSEMSLDIEGPFGGGLAAESDNLILRAARALAGHFQTENGAHFKLTKNLPVASGIGGGSADAAAALRGLLTLWAHDTKISPEISKLGAQLGSDIPVCLFSCAAWMEGRGERVIPLPQLPETHIVLVNPGIAVPTADVFRRLKIEDGRQALAPPKRFSSAAALLDYLTSTRNDLERPARDIAPIIGTVLEALSRNGARFVRMSGSGATCFGLFETQALAQAAAASIATVEPQWWAKAGTFASDAVGKPVPLPQI